MAEQVKAIDCCIVPPSHEETWGIEKLFPGAADRRAKGVTNEQLVAEMDDAGGDRGVLCIESDNDKDWAMSLVKEYPGKFLLSLNVNPVTGGIVKEIRRIKKYIEECGIQQIWLSPWLIQLPPNDRMYFPFYALAAELDLVVGISVGLPGPYFPGWVQDPIYVDEVCYLFPETKILQSHLGYPWVGTACNNVIKWPNCYLMTNAYRPKYFPPELIQHLNTRAQDKIIWGTEYPLLTFKRSLDDIKELPIREHVLPKYLRENALKLFKWE